ncbi:acyl-CoA dehydrogenase family protein [Sporosarcina limicola]|uniref:Alkylation response protein AidB-like acyl-CoA dehydrogenase n=1 Tax=Sporosarcina limicola TaxID=34101 RepID=A0A927MK79_9BACL|nr:acyl-CoA dehydrogenase family protein [Sporosarcina limicola]MBE1555895.1 alkylation response protein AidB-like acyl-CoA dehydrogenase [Sporosarcina limicola]
MERTRHPMLDSDAVDGVYFTPEDFTDDENMIAKTTKQFIKLDAKPQSEKNRPITRSLFEKAGEIGLLGIEVPEAYGGFDLGKKVAGLVAEIMGAAGSFSVSFNIHVGVGTLPYVYFGTEAQKGKYLPKLASGEWIGAYALTEPNAGSDALNSKTSAVLNKEGTGWILNGEKQWITNAQLADCYVVFGKTADGMTAFIVERTFEGVSVGPEEKKMGISGSSTATLILEDVMIPTENVLGEIGKGHHIALNILNMARLKLAFANIGTAKRALHLAVTYAKQRKQFQTALVDFTMTQEKLANMAVRIYGAESAAYRTVGAMDDALQSVESTEEFVNVVADYMIDCAVNKVNSSESLDYIVDEAVQIHGGYGYMQEYEVENLYRDARINRIFEGTNEINRLTIAKGLLKKIKKEKLWPDAGKGNSHIQALERQGDYLTKAKELVALSLKAVTPSFEKAIVEEQEYLRLLANMNIRIYIMESTLVRTEKAVIKNGELEEERKLLMTDVLCEEGYRHVQSAAISFVSAALTDEFDRDRMMKEIQDFSVPIYSNLFIKKRKIARSIIEGARYNV